MGGCIQNNSNSDSIQEPKQVINEEWTKTDNDKQQNETTKSNNSQTTEYEIDNLPLLPLS